MRFRILKTTRAALSARPEANAAIVRRAIRWTASNAHTLQECAPCTQDNSASIPVANIERADFRGHRPDAIILVYLENMPAPVKRQPITVDPEDLNQLIKIPRYTKPPDADTKKLNREL